MSSTSRAATTRFGLRSRPAAMVAMMCLFLLVLAVASARAQAAGPPTVTAVSPDEGSEVGGETVVITGSELSEATSVKFGSNAAKSFAVDSNEEITAVTPAAGETAGVVHVTVTTPSGTSAGTVDFTYLGRPFVDDVTPLNGPAAGGTTVTIAAAGANASSTVSFGSTPASSVSFSPPDTITAVAPPGFGTVDVTVTTPFGGTSAPDLFDHYGYKGGAPEYGRCLQGPLFVKKLGDGEFTDNKCTKEGPAGMSQYGWEPGIPGTALIQASAPKLETAAKEKLDCRTVAITGHQVSATTFSEALVMTGCEFFNSKNQAGPACSSAGLASGEVATALQGTLAWEKKSANKAALVLSAESGPFLQYTCGGVTRTVTGSVLLPLKAGKMETQTKVKLVVSKGKQKPEALENGEQHVLSSSTEGGPSESAGWAFKGTLFHEGVALEIDPVV